MVKYSLSLLLPSQGLDRLLAFAQEPHELPELSLESRAVWQGPCALCLSFGVRLLRLRLGVGIFHFDRLLCA